MLEVDDPALQSDRDRMGPVIRAELVQDSPDVAFHGLFGYGQPGSDFFIGVSACDES
jgi:hypothetical protein